MAPALDEEAQIFVLNVQGRTEANSVSGRVTMTISSRCQ